MAKQVPPHHDRGDGVCDFCFVEWPCDYVTGKGMQQNIGAYERELRDRKMEVQMIENEKQMALIAEACRIIGVNDPVKDRYGSRRYGMPSSIYIPTDDFMLLLNKALGNEPLTQEEIEEAERELDRSDQGDSGLFA